MERLAQAERKTVRRYVAAAEALRVVRDGADSQLTDELIGMMVGGGASAPLCRAWVAWGVLVAHHDDVATRVGEDLNGVKIAEVLARRGVVVPVHTVQEYVREVPPPGRGPTVRAADGEPDESCRSTSAAWGSTLTL